MIDVTDSSDIQMRLGARELCLGHLALRLPLYTGLPSRPEKSSCLPLLNFKSSEFRLNLFCNVLRDL